MVKHASIKIVAAVLMLLIVASAGVSAAVRFSVYMPFDTAKLNVAEFGILKYATPTLGDLFSNVSGPAVKLTVDNSTGTTAGYYQIKASVFYNSALLASVTFGQANANGGFLVEKASTKILEITTQGLNAKDVIDKVRSGSADAIKEYLGGFQYLDVMDSVYNRNVLSTSAMEEAYINRNTLPNGRYRIEISLLEKDGGSWVSRGNHVETFDIMETSFKAVSPMGLQSSISDIEFNLSGFPAQVSCFSVVAQVRQKDGALIWTSPSKTVGSSQSSCAVKAVSDTARVQIPLGDTKLIGGVGYTWSVEVTDPGKKSVLQSPPAPVEFSLPNTQPEVSIGGTSGSHEQGDRVVFEAVVRDKEDEQLGFRTQLEWKVKEPNQTQPVRVGTGTTLAYTFQNGGIYTVTLTATDKFGAVSTASVDVNVNVNQKPSLKVASVSYIRNNNAPVKIEATQAGQVVKLGKTTFRRDDVLVLNVEVSDPNNDTVNVVFRNKQVAFGAQSVSGTSSPQMVEAKLPLSQAPTHVITVEATDARYAIYQLQFEPIKTAASAKPQVIIESPALGSRVKVGSSITLTATVQDPEDRNLVPTWYVVNNINNEEKVIGTGKSTSYIVTEVGTYVLRAEVTVLGSEGDNGQPDKSHATVTIHSYEPVNQKPVVNIEPQSLLVDKPGNYTLSAKASDPEGSKLSYKWWVNNAEVSGDKPQLTYNFNKVGTWKVKVEVSDGTDKAVDEVDVVVSRPATFDVTIKDWPETETDAREFDQNEKVTLEASYDNPDAVTVTWWLSGTTADNTTITNQLVGQGKTATIDFKWAGSFLLKVVADGKGSSGKTERSVTVNANKPPQVESKTYSGQVYVGDTLSIAVGADVDGAASLQVKDDDTISSQRWMLGTKELTTEATYKAVFDRPGIHLFTVEVTDSRGGKGIGTLTVNVLRDQQPPQVTMETPVEGATVPVFAMVALSGRASDAEGPNRIAEEAWFVDGERVTGKLEFAPKEERTYVVTYTAKDLAGNVSGATARISAVKPRIAVKATAVDAAGTEQTVSGGTVQLVKSENGEAKATVKLSADLTTPAGESNYQVNWYVTLPGESEQAIGDGKLSLSYNVTKAGNTLVRVEAKSPYANATPVQAVTSFTVLNPPALQGEGVNKTVIANAAPEIKDVWAEYTDTPGVRVTAPIVGKQIRLFADASDPDASEAISVAWEENGSGIGVVQRQQGTNLYYTDYTFNSYGSHTLSAVATDARGERTARQLVLAGQNQPPQIKVTVPSGANQKEPVTLLVDVTDQDGQRVTVTWFLNGAPVGSGYVTGKGKVSTDISFPVPGNFELTVRVEDAAGEKVEEIHRIRVASTAEPIITSPVSINGSTPVVANPVQFSSINIPDNATVQWKLDNDSTLYEDSTHTNGESAFTATLTSGAHTITLWVGSIGTSVDVWVQDAAETAYDVVGTVTGWEGSPSIKRPDGTIIKFAKGAALTDYTADKLSVNDVDTLLLQGQDTITIHVKLPNVVRTYNSAVNKMHLDVQGNPNQTVGEEE